MTQCKVCVLGLGYIGLPTSSILASRGYTVVGVDINPEVVKTINSGRIHIVEPDLDTLVRSAVQSGHLRATLKPEPADIFIIAVPTPFRVDKGGIKTPDLSYVESATRSISPVLKRGDIVILESTSPVGTTEGIRNTLLKARPDLFKDENSLHIAHCPERVLPGNILKEFVENDRIVGVLDKESIEKVTAFYKSFVRGNIHITTARTAEMCKLTENAYRDTNIAFANELSIICDKLDIDVWELIALANKHPRVKILQPGPGVGGHCIAVDPWFIVDSAPEEARLIRTSREINDNKVHWVVDKVVEATQGRPTARIACLGLAYKPDIDDLRESPSLEVACELRKMGFQVFGCEPNVSFKEISGVPLLTYEEVLNTCDILVILVNHTAFKNADRTNWQGKTIIEVVK